MEKLSKKEEEAMRAIWKLGSGFVKDFLEILPDPKPHYNTLSSTIKNLEKKGFVKGRKFGPIIQYSTLISEDAYKRNFLGGIVEHYFENSYQDLVAFFATDERINPEDLMEIIAMIENKKKK
ncbi:MAG: BlaI/MecI/CopY family transcriptional regulator [Chitinophagaceae bacterium]